MEIEFQQFFQKFSETTVSEVLSGKAYSRDLRGYLIVDWIISILLLDKMIRENSLVKTLAIKQKSFKTISFSVN